jgi:succinate dehydrogenase / fumarate reductase, cytochrome b subunit
MLRGRPAGRFLLEVEPAHMDAPEPSFWARHSFIIRRLHSLSGLVPVGGYMVIHLAVNASVLNSPASFQSNVASIHRFGPLLLTVLEWTLIFIPILFHGIVGIIMVAGALPNTHQYPYEANRRYTLQRVTGVIAFVFIALHVFHMHGWFHNSAWVKYVVEPWGGAQFKPYNATSTAGLALQPVVWLVIYLVGMLSCVFHLANGLWTMGITWGVWTSPAAQRRALGVCAVFGVLLAGVGLGALFGMRAAVSTDEELARVRAREERMIEHDIEAGTLRKGDIEHKRAEPLEADGEQANAARE